MNDNGKNNSSVADQQRDTLAMTLSTWDLERTRRERKDTPRSRIVTLRAHERLQSLYESRIGVPPARQTELLIQDNAKAACLLIHGVENSPVDLQPLTQYLHRHGLTVYCPLLPGHGLADPPEILWRACMQDVRLRFRQLRKVYRKVFVVGYGFGGALGIHLAAKEPVTALVLLAPALVPRVSLAERILFRLGIHRLPWLRPRWGWTEEVLGAMKGARDKVSRLRIPVYAVQCDDDERISPLSLRILQKNTRHKASRFQAFPSGGHNVLQAHGDTSLHADVLKFVQVPLKR